MKLSLFTLTVLATSAHAMEEKPNALTLGDTPLHTAVRAMDFNKAVNLLTEPTWMPEELPQHALFPADAAANMKLVTMGSPESEKCMKRMAQFTVALHKYSKHQGSIMQAMRTALNAQAKTAYDVAAEAKAHESVLAILNPDIQHILLQHTILQKIQQRVGFDESFGAKIAFCNASNKGPNEPLFNPGDKIVIEGKEYKCQSAEKII